MCVNSILFLFIFLCRLHPEIIRIQQIWFLVEWVVSYLGYYKVNKGQEMIYDEAVLFPDQLSKIFYSLINVII